MRICNIDGCEDPVYDDSAKGKFCWVCSQSKKKFTAVERNRRNRALTKGEIYIVQNFTYADRREDILAKSEGQYIKFPNLKPWMLERGTISTRSSKSSLS